jgi:Zn ribbon nucleic-acid-binding protein
MLIDHQSHAFDPARCPVCERTMSRVRMIWRAFQDDMEVWECGECGASVAQIVDTARLARRVAPAMLLN